MQENKFILTTNPFDGKLAKQFSGKPVTECGPAPANASLADKQRAADGGYCYYGNKDAVVDGPVGILIAVGLAALAGFGLVSLRRNSGD